MTEFLELAMEDAYKASGLKQRELGEFVYAAQSWARERRLITRRECGPQGCSPRYLVTSLTGEPKALYDDLYCQRGEAENRIKQAQVHTLRIKRLTVAAVLTRNTRRIRRYLASSWPSAVIFAQATRQLSGALPT